MADRTTNMAEEDQDREVHTNEVEIDENSTATLGEEKQKIKKEGIDFKVKKKEEKQKQKKGDIDFEVEKNEEKEKIDKKRGDQVVSRQTEKEKIEIKMDQEVEKLKDGKEQESELKLDCIFDDSSLGFKRATKEEHKLESEDPLEEINLGTVENRKVTYISKLLQRELKEEIIRVLHEYKDCFA
ncbi:transcription initiation factor TFIID subunit 3-like [Cajanus cajan]|uniref:transcription initiation factor TFIID subunit 3-like n=1 Tax=Cajanus cajan TaxID=3821 RepID=UPI00098DC0B0|nr:transcription initiation factor TFIID subunit 3-like [Cajanus cajan]